MITYLPPSTIFAQVSTGPNPIDNADFFVRQHYIDFLNRQPDANELASWTNQLTLCGSDQACIDTKRIDVSTAFYLSMFQNWGYLVERLYKTSFGNLPGAPVPIRLSEFLPDTGQISQGVIVGQTGWEQVLENNKQAFTAAFVQRSRFTSAFPTSMSPAQLVDSLFVNGGVTPSATERNAAINEFGGAMNSADTAARARALRRVAENSTLAQQEFNRAFVLMQFFGYLRRNPNDPPDTDYIHYDSLLARLNQFNGNYVNAEMVKLFITSREYRERFGPAATLQFSSAAYSVNENAGTATITVTRANGDASGGATVNYATSNGTATAGADYAVTSGTLSFATGDTSMTFSIPITNDSLNETNETINLTLSNVTGSAALYSPSTAVLTITDDDPLPTLSVDDVSVTEGNSGTTNANFTVSLSAASGRTVTINYATANGTATAGSDYQGASGTLTFNPGDTSKPITVLVSGDALNEADETFVVNLSGASGANIADNQGVGTITNDDSVPSLSINDVSVTEGNSGTTIANFTVSLSAASGQTVMTNYATANGTATPGSDYVATSGALTFTPGQTTKSIPVTVNSDTTNEPDETFFVDLSNPANATIARSGGTGTIINDDLPRVQFSASLYIVGEGDQRVTLAVTRSAGDTSGASSVGFVTSDSASSQNCNVFNGLASSRCDYLTSVGTVQFAAGETAKTLSIPIIDDSYAEGNETFTVSLNNASGASLGMQSATTVMIVDNETTAGQNPIDQANFFVRLHYIDFLNREPDAAGLAFWSNQIIECQQVGATCDPDVRRTNVSAAFFLSIEFQETGYLVYRMYKAGYGDIPGTPVPVGLSEFLPDTQQIGLGVVVGVGNWQAQLESNKVAFALEFVSRTRFTALYPTTMTPAEFVDALFMKAGVTPSTADRNAAVNEFGTAGNTSDTAARGRALRRVAENSILNQQETNKAFVLMQYFGYLRRNPNDPPEANLDFGGYNFWLGKLNQFNGNFVDAEMVKAFIISSEYRQRFGP